MVNPPPYYDVIIVGAGLIGASLACLLAKTGYRVAVIEEQHLISSQATEVTAGVFSLRVNAYNLATEALFRQIGIWQHLPCSRMYPFSKVEVWDSQNGAKVNFSAEDIKVDYLGHFIENIHVVQGLQQYLLQCPKIELLSETHLDHLKVDQDRVVVKTTNGRLSSKLLVGCDGVNSQVRKLVAINQSQTPYKQHCIVANMGFSGDLENTAWQRFLTTGPLGLLPLAKGYCSLAWSCDQDYASQLLGLSDGDFIEVLDEAIVKRLGKITQLSMRKSFPLAARHANCYYDRRIVLLGDSAHAIHPLAGLGANIGLQDVLALANLLQRCWREKADPGSLQLLNAYERKRRLHNQMMITAMTLFNTIFSNNKPWLKKARHVAMVSANRLMFIKKLLLNQAAWMKFLD